VGILEGLVRIGVLRRDGECYYPSWGRLGHDEQRWRDKIRGREVLSHYDVHGQKKFKLDN
jgi:hypothetical protein